MRIMANYIIDNGHAKPGDADLFFGEPATTLPGATSFADLLVQLGIFSSKGQARKAGWNAFPPGFSMHIIGKLRHEICVLCPIPEGE